MTRCPPGVRCRGVIPALAHSLVQSDELTIEFNEILNTVQTFSRLKALDPSATFHAPLDFTTRDLFLTADSFTRGTPGAFYRPVGDLLAQAGEGIPRFESQRLLIEPPATNYAYPSNAFSSPPWGTGSGIILQAEADIAPDGTRQAWRMTDPGGSGSAPEDCARIFGLYNQTFPEGMTFASVFLKKTEGALASFPVFGFTLAASATVGSRALLSINTTTGEAVPANQSGWQAPIDPDEWVVEDWGAWWRVIVYKVNTGSNRVTNRWRFWPAYSATLGGVPDGSMTGSHVVYLSDLQSANKVTSPILSTDAPTSRALDALTYAPINFFNVAQGMCVFAINLPSRVDVLESLDRRLLTFDDASAAFIYYTGPSPARFVLHGGTTATTIGTESGSIEKDRDYLIAARWNAGVKQIGYLDPFSDNWNWSTEDGYTAFSTAENLLRVAPPTGATDDPVRFKDLVFYNEDKGRAWIEANHPL